VKAFTDYMFVLPSGAAGHGTDPDRMRSTAELLIWQGWLLGCRNQPPADDAPRARRRVVVVTPLGTVGAPVGTLAAALARAGAREGCVYALSALDAAATR
jgi:hypothetical protein